MLDNSPAPVDSTAKWRPSVTHSITRCTRSEPPPGRHSAEEVGEEKGVVYRSYVDALWTVHLAGCEAVTVSSGLADNMAKGIHLEQRGHTNKRPGQTKAVDNKDSRAHKERSV